MPPTSDPSGAVVLVDGLAEWGLTALGPRVQTAVMTALAAQELHSADGAELSIAFVTDEEIARLNDEWLDRAGPTDVIAFGLGEAPLVGDIYISVDTARRQAGELGLDVDEEILRLVVHGVLHVAGYDHPAGDDRAGSPMYRLQERVLVRLLEDGPGG